MSDAKQDLIVAFQNAGTDDVREVITEMLDFVVDVRVKGGAQHEYAGVKAPPGRKNREKAARGMASAFKDWSGSI